MRRAITYVAMSALLLSFVLVAPLSRPATAATGTYWFHGKSTDQVDKQAALVNDTAISGATFNQTALIDAIVEAAAGTTVTIKDPSGRTIATATVDNGGVIDLQALPDGAGAYALILHASAAGDTAFTVWEVLTEAR